MTIAAPPLDDQNRGTAIPESVLVQAAAIIAVGLRRARARKARSAATERSPTATKR